MKTFAVSLTIKSALAAALLTTSVGCGPHGSPTKPGSLTPPPISTPAPDPVPGLEANTVSASKDGVPGVYRRDFETPLGGTAMVILRWADAHYSLQLYVTSGACADITDLLMGACTILGKTRPGDLPGLVSGRVAGGALNTIWVLNPDSVPQGFTVGLEIDE